VRSDSDESAGEGSGPESESEAVDGAGEEGRAGPSRSRKSQWEKGDSVEVLSPEFEEWYPGEVWACGWDGLTSEWKTTPTLKRNVHVSICFRTILMDFSRFAFVFFSLRIAMLQSQINLVSIMIFGCDVLIFHVSTFAFGFFISMLSLLNCIARILSTRQLNFIMFRW
jgi:hypothetical protein